MADPASEPAPGPDPQTFDESAPAARLVQPWLQSIIPDRLPSDDAEIHRHERRLPSSPFAAKLLEVRQRRRALYTQRYITRTDNAASNQPLEGLAHRMRSQSLTHEPVETTSTSSDPAGNAAPLASVPHLPKRKRSDTDDETSPPPEEVDQIHTPAELPANEPIAVDSNEVDVEQTIRGGLVAEGKIRESVEVDNVDSLFPYLPFRRSADAAARCPIVVRSRPRMRRRKQRKVEDCPDNGDAG